MPWAWVLAAFLIASTRLTELGISLDPSLFASIARNFSRTWDFWNMSASENLFPHYYEHPFLPYWLQGVVFYLFGASDFTARLLGLVLGSGTFYFLYKLGEELQDSRFAHFYCFLTLFSIYFTGRMPTFYSEIPLTFFMMGSLYLFLKSLRTQKIQDSIFSGIMLGLAFLTKGLAVLPMLGTIGLVALYRLRFKAFISSLLWSCLLSCSVIVGLFIGLQSHYGEYSFIRQYLNSTLFYKVAAANSQYFSWPFFAKLFETHGIHVILALGACFTFRKRKLPSQAMVVGAISSVLFVTAAGLLRKDYLHYYYPLYPMINILAAAFCYPWLVKVPTLRWIKIALGFALLYQVLWHVLPFQMRRKPAADYYQLTGVVAELKQSGVPRLEALHISFYDWPYREMSLWYWDMDTYLAKSLDEVKGPAVVLPQGQRKTIGALQEKGYLLCAQSPLYTVLVNTQELQEKCYRAPFPRKMLK